MFQRIRKNPGYYSVGKGEEQSWEDRVDEMVLESLEQLKKSELIEQAQDDKEKTLRSTEYGDIMNKVWFFLLLSSW